MQFDEYVFSPLQQNSNSVSLKSNKKILQQTKLYDTSKV